jgi:hypothetical protein
LRIKEIFSDILETMFEEQDIMEETVISNEMESSSKRQKQNSTISDGKMQSL